jgi:acyl-CoA synthetase (AMP-forming)/AMP-acid ligase II
MQINHFLENSAQKFSDKPAVWYKNQWMNFGEIEVCSNKVANYLVECGMKRGDRIAILFENSFDYIISYYAVLKIGCVTVALNTETTTESLIYYLNDSGARTIIAQRKFSKFLAPAIQKTANIEQVIIDQDDLSVFEEIGHCNQVRLKDVYHNSKESPPAVRSIDIDLGSLVYTSGSTGKPKGVTLTHQNVVSNTKSIVKYLNLTATDRIMVVLPFYYIYGKSLLNTHFFVGGSVVIDNRFAYPNVILETMKKTEVTGFAGVPSTFMILLSRSSIHDHIFPSLRYITQAGGAMAASIQKKVVNVFSPAHLYIMYGATEASARLSYLEPDQLTRKWGSIGKAIPNVDLFIADERGNPKPPNSEGEIAARGSNIMQGYWNDLDSTKKVLRNGLYYTGDIGYMDDEGFLFVIGRIKDIIKVGGERVSAKEIEETILQLKKVREVAVIGVEDEYLGEAVKAYVVLQSNDQISELDIKTYCKKKLPLYKQPKFIEIINDLPKNKSGKILKNKLKEQHKNSLIINGQD